MPRAETEPGLQRCLLLCYKGKKTHSEELHFWGEAGCSDHSGLEAQTSALESLPSGTGPGHIFRRPCKEDHFLCVPSPGAQEQTDFLKGHFPEGQQEGPSLVRKERDKEGKSSDQAWR